MRLLLRHCCCCCCRRRRRHDDTLKSLVGWDELYAESILERARVYVCLLFCIVLFHTGALSDSMKHDSVSSFSRTPI